MTVANQQVTGNIFGTGSWDMYRQVKVGELQLKEGTAEVSFSSAGKLKTSYLTDLRAVELRLKK